jgi:hypothetical protein
LSDEKHWIKGYVSSTTRMPQTSNNPPANVLLYL